MVLSREITTRIREVLEKHPEGLSITDLVRSVDINRNTAGRYLENMLLSGQVEMRRFGMAKMYTLTKRLPVSSVLSISSELVLQLDSSLRVIYANDPLLTFLHVPAKDLFGKNIEFTQFSIVFEDVFSELLDRFRRGHKGEEWYGELSSPVEERFFFCRIAPNVSSEGSKGVSVLLEDITDQKRDGERIRESEARLRSIFTVSPIGIGLVADRVFLEVNDFFCEMTGYTPAELVGKSVRMLYSSDEAFATVGTLYYNQIRRSGAGSIETQWVKKDGTTIDVLMNSTPLDPANIAGGITFTAMDITERKRSERALRKSESRLQLALSGSEMGMWEIDIPSLKGSIDERAAAILGMQKSDIGTYSADWDALSHPDDVPLIHQRLINHIEGREVIFESEHRMRHTSGRWIWVLGRGKIINRLPDGSCIRISGTMQDITARKQAEEALREGEEKYRYLVEQSLQGLTIIQNGRPVFANSAMQKISGYALKDYLTLSAEEMIATVHPYDRQRIADVMADRLKGKNVPPENEFRILRSDGTIRWVLTHGSLITYNGAPAIQVAYFDITGRKQAEEALTSNEERLRQITETLTSVFYVHDRASNRFSYVSQAYEKIWKRSCQSLCDNPYTYLEAVHPDDLPRLLESIRQELEEGVYVDTEFRIIQPDGTIRWIHSQNFPIFDSRGMVYRVAGTAEDITSRKKAEDALRESEEKFRTLFEGALNPVMIANREGRYIEANEAALRFLETGREDLLKKHVWDYSPEELFETQMREHEPFTAPRTVETVYQVNGRRKTLILNVIPTQVRGEQVLIAIGQDITERKQAEEALRESEDRYRKLVEISPDAVILHQDGKIIYMNPAALRILGARNSSQMTGRGILEIIHPDYRNVVMANIDKDLAGEGSPAVELQLLRTDGTPVFVKGRGVGTFIDGRPAVLVAISDITKHRHAEQALKESEERYRTLAEASQDIIFLIGSDDRVEYVNSYAAAVQGVPAHEIIGKKRSSLFSGEMEQRQAQGLRRVFETGKAGHSEGAMEVAGTLRWFDHYLMPIMDARGTVTSVLGVSRDITGRKMAEDALKESEERYRRLLEQTFDAIAVHKDRK